MIYVVPSAVSLRSTQISLVCSLDSSNLHFKGTTVFQELAGHDGGQAVLFYVQLRHDRPTDSWRGIGQMWMGSVKRVPCSNGGSTTTSNGFRHRLDVNADTFSWLQSGKGNKTADWATCGASKSLSCRPWDAASSLPFDGWGPNKSISSRCFLLKPNERLFHTLRYAPRNEVGLLVFDRQFDLSNLSSTPLLVASPAFTSGR
jgi:hypothetical protein